MRSRYILFIIAILTILIALDFFLFPQIVILYRLRKNGL
jgi:hypothetical protein